MNAITLALLMGTMGQFGYPGLYTAVAVQPQFQTRRFLAEGYADFSPTHKYDGSGFSYRAGGELGGRIDKQFWVGAGGLLSETVTDQWSKSAFRPHLSFEFRQRAVQAIVRYRFSGFDPHNHLHGIEIEAKSQLTRLLGFEVQVFHDSFTASDQPGTHLSGSGFTYGPTFTFGGATRTE